MDGWRDGWLGGWMDGWMGGWVDGWVNGWVDGWMDGWVGGGPRDTLVDSAMQWWKFFLAYLSVNCFPCL